MKVCVLASGSKGNSTYIETEESKILIDLGPTTLYIEQKLKDLNINPKDITSILISHTHSDHVNGLKVFIKKYNPTLYLTKKMYEDLSKLFEIKKFQLIEKDFNLNDLNIKVIKTSHDASDSNGYIVEKNNKSVVYITDTGYINKKNHSKLQNKNIYIFESNHDVDMLMNGKYPYHLKQRILGDKGHLSNKDSSYYLSNFIGEDTKTIILSHLSQDNNTQELALNTLNETLKNNDKKIKNIIVATQNERTELVEV